MAEVSHPDYSGTKPVSAAHGFDTQALSQYLIDHLPGFKPPLKVAQFKGGQSNPTYLLSSPSGQWVMRTKPGPASKLLPSAHAIEREFRVMQALHSTAVPVARMWVLCDDESVIGRAFYLMEHIEGRVIWDQALPGMTSSQRGAYYDELNRVIADLHRIDAQAVGLSDFGRPGNYFERQITRWSKQYMASITRPIEAMDRLIDWLPSHIPPTATAETQPCIVHGDFRLDNVIFHPTEPRILAVLDWELSTLGHPLADFSYHCMSWHIPHTLGRGIAGHELSALGIPEEIDYLRLYCQRTGRTDEDQVLRDWSFYLAYNLFRIAAILQGIAKRVEDGTAASEQARSASASAPQLAALAWSFAQQAH